MYKMRNRIRHRPATRLLCLALTGMAGGAMAAADSLSLAEAERLALEGDPSIRAVEYRREALDERQVAAAQLPDPMFKLGAVSLPTDTFDIDQEPMTQLQLGLMQNFPRGDSRALRAAQLRERAQSLDYTAQDLALRIRLTVREEYLEVLKQRRLAAINRQAEAAFADLEDIIRDYYATGRVPQQDVLRASVELGRARERTERIEEEKGRARARLTAWLGEDAWRDFPDQWPTLPGPRAPEYITENLPDHPRLLAVHQQVLAAETGVELAKQNYKPGFTLGLTYGARSGYGPDGRSRPDFLSLMVTMDVPLFTARRQDRQMAASIAESSAATYQREDLYRRMYSEVAMHAQTLERQRERLALFRETLLPEARFNTEAAFDAYQAAVQDLTTLMRAQLTEFDLQLEYARLTAENSKTRARLLYLQGGES